MLDEKQKQAEHYQNQIRALTEFAPAKVSSSSAADKAEIANLKNKVERRKDKIKKLRQELEDSKNLVETLQATINEVFSFLSLASTSLY